MHLFLDFPTSSPFFAHVKIFMSLWENKSGRLRAAQTHFRLRIGSEEKRTTSCNLSINQGKTFCFGSSTRNFRLVELQIFFFTFNETNCLVLLGNGTVWGP